MKLSFAFLFFAFARVTGMSSDLIADNKDAFLQGIVITGTVIDIEGQPIPGVNILIQGTNIGTASDIDGRYSIAVPNRDVQLQFSYLGFGTQEITVGNQTVVNVTLYEDVRQIEEVVVVAYGVQKKVSVTGAISTVQTKELKQSSAANFTATLAGQLPGLSVLSTSGQPGYDAVNLYLRGRGTINGANPLILIDGIPRSDISSLDPNEIASVSILKDASATAVFGVRGANGVVLITTRRGTEGKTELSITMDHSLQKFLARPDRIHSWEFAELRNQACRNDNKEDQYTPYMIDMYKSGADPVFFPDRDVFHEYFYDWTPQTRVNVNLNGGNEKLKYFMNVGYVGQSGLFKTESKESLGYDPSFKMDRYTFRANVDYNITKGLKLSLNLASYLEKMNSPSTWTQSDNLDQYIAQLLEGVWYTPPGEPGPVTGEGYFTPDGEEVPPNEPIFQTMLMSTHGFVNRVGYRQQTKNLLNSSLALDWALDFITPGLNTKFVLAFDNTARTILQGMRDHNVYNYQVATSPNEKNTYSPRYTNINESIRLGKSMASNYYMNLQYSLNYARRFGRHDVSAMALFQRDSWENYGADLPYNMLGLVGRVTYGYDDRYLGEVNIGYNGSEQFAPANRFGFFPAYSLGWVVSNEGFLKNNPLLTLLKLRASFGKVGNDNMGGARFLYISNLTEQGNGWVNSLGYKRFIRQGLIGNDNLQWEVSQKQNYGMDIQLFKSLSLTVDVFFEQRDKILISRGTVPTIQGVDLGLLPKVNMGRVDNQGYEMELTYFKSINRDLSFTVKGNYAFNNNKVIFADEPILGEDYAYRYRSTGYSIGQPFGYKIDYSNGNGYINTQEELDQILPHSIGGTPRIGDFKYVDVNGDGEISDRDMVPIGYSTIPRITYGFSGNLTYKNWDFSFLFTGIAQSSSTAVGKYEYAWDGFYSGWHLHAWTQERYESGEKILYPALSTTNGISIKNNDHFIMDRDFLRLKNLELGYSLPQHWIKPIGISRVRAYVNGNNLWTWTKYPVSMIDPEQTSSSVYPLVKMVNFGLNVVF